MARAREEHPSTTAFVTRIDYTGGRVVKGLGGVRGMTDEGTLRVEVTGDAAAVAAFVKRIESDTGRRAVVECTATWSGSGAALADVSARVTGRVHGSAHEAGGESALTHDVAPGDSAPSGRQP